MLRWIQEQLNIMMDNQTISITISLNRRLSNVIKVVKYVITLQYWVDCYYLYAMAAMAYKWTIKKILQLPFNKDPTSKPKSMNHFVNVSQKGVTFSLAGGQIASSFIMYCTSPCLCLWWDPDIGCIPQ